MPIHFFTKLRGTSYCQDAVKFLQDGETLNLVRDPDNEFDKNCIEAWHWVHGKIGVFSSDLASKYASVLDSGIQLKCVVIQVTGKNRSDGFLGVNVEVSAV